MKHIFDDLFVLKSELTSNGHPLLWREDLGIGYLKSTEMIYDAEYWENYQQYAHSLISEKLNEARMSFVQRHIDYRSGKSIIDVGIGNDAFVTGMHCKGTDINPKAIEWLIEQDLFGDPNDVYDVSTFWDVLEHIEDPTELLISPNVFVSLPIHDSFEACLKSKHLKPDEHIWHFTHKGFIRYMRYYGYHLIDWNDDESKCGREHIESFYFICEPPADVFDLA